MILGIVTDCTHYKNSEGKVCTENHILLRQLQQLSLHFDQTFIACPFGNFDSSKVVTAYQNGRIQFLSLPLVGGNNFKSKLQLLATIPKWVKAFKYLEKNTDIIYQRFPNNLNIPGFLYFWLKKKPVFATYTGTWKGYPGEAFSYSMQRWILEKPFKGPVWVYDNELLPKGKIKAGFSPSYSLAEWEEERDQVQNRIAQIQQFGLEKYRFITVGTLIDYKNQLEILHACKKLKEHAFPFSLTIVGDGPMKQQLQDYINHNDLHSQVTLVGKNDHKALREMYRQHDFVVQAPLKEGFGKVPVEGFFHGLVPIINNISMASAMTGNGQRGILFDASKPNDLADTLLALPTKMKEVPAMIENGRAYAKSQTLEAWAKEYFDTVSSFYGYKA